MAIGLQKGFDWGGVALAAIGGGVTAGLAAPSALGEMIRSTGKAAPLLSAATNSALTQGIGVLTGVQEHFSWKNVAASALAAPVAGAAGRQAAQVSKGSFGSHLAAGVAGSLVRSAVGGKVDMTSVLVDGFGNALGNSIVEGMQPKSALRPSTSEELGMQTMGKAMEGWLNEGSEGAGQWNDIGSLSGGGLPWESGVRTYPYIPPEEPTVMPLPEGPTVAGSSYNRHSLDDALIGGLKILNDKTQIPPLVNARIYLEHQLEGWADRTLQEGPSVLTPLYGGLYAAGKAGVELFPTGAVDVVPELGALGSLTKLRTAGRVLDGLGSTANRTADGLDVAYNARAIGDAIEYRYPGQITSSTLPTALDKNASLAGMRHPISGIVFDTRGFPIFDDVAVFDTRIARNYSSVENSPAHMRAATRDLRGAIARGELSSSRFTREQLRAIQGGKATIPNWTWHHHQDVGRMQLIPTSVHQQTGHVGGFEMWFR